MNAATWTPSRLVAVGLGGALGATARWAVLTTTGAGRFPWPVLLVNIVGSVLLGVFMAEEWARPPHRLWLHDAGGIGFCGGLTTFSTFSVEVVDLVRDGDGTVAAAYVAVSVLTAIAGVVAGAGALRRVRALTLPLEERP